MLIENNGEAQFQSEMDAEPLMTTIVSGVSDVKVEINPPISSDNECNKVKNELDSSNNECNDQSVMANASIAINSVSVLLHPLVIMNISEHWTWTRAKYNEVRPIYGALIGKQKGRSIEIMNSFEMICIKTEDQVSMVNDYFTQKAEQYKQVFSDLDFLGWYTTGDAPTKSDVNFHRQISEINESLVLLKLNPYVGYMLINRSQISDINSILFLITI